MELDNNYEFPDGWGINNASAPLRDVLLGDPAEFEWRRVTTNGKSSE